MTCSSCEGAGEGQTIGMLAKEVALLAQQIVALEETGSNLLLQTSVRFADRAAMRSPCKVARELLRERRLREEIFGESLFSDPSWDMLLDLFASTEEGRSVSVSSLCIAATVPPTTALRWIEVLFERGLVTRSRDPSDGRRVFVRLSPTASTSMVRYLQKVREDFADPNTTQLQSGGPLLDVDLGSADNAASSRAAAR